MKSNFLRSFVIYSVVTPLAFCASIATMGQEPQCEQTREGRVCRVKQEINAGVAVDTDKQRRLGLVTVNGGCSGTLLNQFWVLTARHCVTVDGNIGGVLAAANRIAVTAAWAPRLTVRGSRISEFKINSAPGSTPDRDIVLLYLASDNFGEVDIQRIYTTAKYEGDSIKLSGRLKTTDTVTQYGIGYSTFAVPPPVPFGAPVPSMGQGMYRSAQFNPADITETHYNLYMNPSNQSGHGGDSGGPSVVTVGGYGAGIAGVQSTCRPTGYVPGLPQVWLWATGISLCTYVSTEPFMGEISDAIRETPQGGSISRTRTAVSNDFNDDGSADILWYNSSTGESQIWHMSAASRIGRSTVTDKGKPAYIGPPFHIVGSRDFDGDGDTDLLWYNTTTGETQIWHMRRAALRDTATVVDETGTAIYIGPPFSIAGTNMDHKPQIIWYNSTTGETQLWRMNDNRIGSRLTLLGEDGKPIYVGPPFSIVGSGDFNGDGKDDVVWHNATTGETQIWLMNDRNVTGRRTVLGEDGRATFIRSPWGIVGANDFNRDGAADLLWYNEKTSETQIWYMNGHSLLRRATVDADSDGGGALVGPPWSIMKH
jgi:hypothetical protein